MNKTYQNSMWLVFIVLILATAYYTNWYIAFFVTVLSLLVYPLFIKKPTRKQIPESVKREVWERQNKRCPMTGETDLDLIEFHHIKPRSKGGSSTDPANIAGIRIDAHQLCSRKLKR